MEGFVESIGLQRLVETVIAVVDGTVIFIIPLSTLHVILHLIALLLGLLRRWMHYLGAIELLHLSGKGIISFRGTHLRNRPKESFSERGFLFMLDVLVVDLLIEPLIVLPADKLVLLFELEAGTHLVLH